MKNKQKEEKLKEVIRYLANYTGFKINLRFPPRDQLNITVASTLENKNMTNKEKEDGSRFSEYRIYKDKLREHYDKKVSLAKEMSETDLDYLLKKEENLFDFFLSSLED